MKKYREVMKGLDYNGTEGIVHMKVTVQEGHFITYRMKACIIDCQQLMPRNQYMLLLPDEFPRKNIRLIQARLFDIKKKKIKLLNLMRYEDVVEVFNHRCLPLKPTRIPKHVSKYSKTILQIKSPTELSNQLFGVGGDESSDKTRPELVKLKFISGQNAQHDVLEICHKDDVLYPCGILFCGKEETDCKYEVKVIGSYSVCENGKITCKCILDEADRNPEDEIDHSKEENTSEHAKVNQTNTSADCSKASNGQNAAMNTDSVPSGSVLSDSSQLEDKQAHNTNKPGVVATNCELNITVANAENYPLALESEEFLNEDKGEGGVVPNKNTGKNNVKPAAAEQKALDDEKPSSVQEGLVPISKKGKNPVKPAATGGLLTVRTKFPSSQSADESFANPDDISSDRGTLQLAPYASRSAEILNSDAPMAKMISLLNRLRGSPPIDYYELVKQIIQTQLTFGKLSKGIEELSNEFMEDEKLIKENLRENQSGQEIEKVIRKNALRQNIVNDLKISLALAQTLRNVYELFIKQVLEERIKDKETIEKLREELDRTKTKLHKLEKENSSSQQQAKNEAQGPHDSIDSLQEKKMIEILALMEKSISRPEQTTLPTELVEKMKQFISLSKKRCDNFRKRSSESSDDDSPDARSNR